MDVEDAAIVSEGTEFPRQKLLVGNGNTLDINIAGEKFGWQIARENIVNISTSESRSGSRSLVMTKLPFAQNQTKQRAEVSSSNDQNLQTLSNGSERYFGFSLKLDPGYWDNPTGWMNLSQWGQPGFIGINNFLFQVDGQGRFLCFVSYGRDGGAVRRNYTRTLFTPQTGVWYDFVLGFKLDTASIPDTGSVNVPEGQGNGHLKIWYKTEHQQSFTENSLNNIAFGYKDLPLVFAKHPTVGIYCQGTSTRNRIFFDNLRHGESFGSVANPYLPPAGWTQLEFQHSNKCVDNKAGTTNGVGYHQWSCGSNPNRNFRFEPLGNNRWLVRSEKSNRCLDVADGFSDNGAKLHQWDCNAGNPNQKWQIVDRGNGWFNLKAERGGRCLEVAGGRTNPQARIQQWNCSDAGHRLLKFR